MGSLFIKSVASIKTLRASFLKVSDLTEISWENAGGIITKNNNKSIDLFMTL